MLKPRSVRESDKCLATSLKNLKKVVIDRKLIWEWVQRFKTSQYYWFKTIACGGDSWGDQLARASKIPCIRTNVKLISPYI